MENPAASATAAASTAGGAPSLKKLKREAAQRRKAQARSLKLRAEEQERLQRLEIDALVEQQRLQRLERQRCEQDAAVSMCLQTGTSLAGSVQQVNEHGRDSLHKLKAASSAGGGKVAMRVEGGDGGPGKGKGSKEGGWKGNKEAQRAKQAQQQSMRAAVESRRRLARGPRSGAATDCHTMLPSEDHRVVSTEYQAAGTQALMRVTLLAAGFVIGARGISARLIGQVTGAIVQSWTESCRAECVPIRLFRIQGKKGVVQAAVGLIEQAVGKYKELCECKRRGEFVQREHVINGVEFYYQPPPRKAFAITTDACSTSAANSNSSSSGKAVASNSVEAAVAQAQAQLSFTTHHVWLQHLHAQQQKQAHDQSAVSHQQLKAAVVAAQSQLQSQGHVLGQTQTTKQQQHCSFYDWQQHQSQGQQQQEEIEEAKREESGRCAAELELIDQGLQQSVASLEQALQQVRLEQRLLQQNRSSSSSSSGSSSSSSTCASYVGSHSQMGMSLWSDVLSGHAHKCVHGHEVADDERGGATGFQLGSSLFSMFGNGGLPIPMSTGGEVECRLDTGGSSVGGLLSSGVSASLGSFDFLTQRLPAFPFAAAAHRDVGPLPEYSLYGHNQIDSDGLCVVCLEQPAGVRLMACGHTSFCFNCVQGLVNCPLCQQNFVHCRTNATASRGATEGSVSLSPSAAASAANANGNGACPTVPPKLNGSSSYHLWNWIPGASV